MTDDMFNAYANSGITDDDVFYVSKDGEEVVSVAGAEREDAAKTMGGTFQKEFYRDAHGNEYFYDANSGQSEEDWLLEQKQQGNDLTKAGANERASNYIYSHKLYRTADGDQVFVREDEEEDFQKTAMERGWNPQEVVTKRWNGLDVTGSADALMAWKQEFSDGGVLSDDMMAALGATEEDIVRGKEYQAGLVQKIDDELKQKYGEIGFIENEATGRGLATIGKKAEGVGDALHMYGTELADAVTLDTYWELGEMAQQLGGEDGLQKIKDMGFGGWTRASLWGGLSVEEAVSMTDEQLYERLKDIKTKQLIWERIKEVRGLTTGAKIGSAAVDMAKMGVEYTAATLAAGALIVGTGGVGAIGAAGLAGVAAAGATAGGSVLAGGLYTAGHLMDATAEQTADRMYFNPATGKMEKLADGREGLEALGYAAAGAATEFAIERIGGKIAGKALGVVGKPIKKVVEKAIGKEMSAVLGLSPGIVQNWNGGGMFKQTMMKVGQAYHKMTRNAWGKTIQSGIRGCSPSGLLEEMTEEVIQAGIDGGFNIRGYVDAETGKIAGASWRAAGEGMLEVIKSAPEFAATLALYNVGAGVMSRGSNALIEAYGNKATMKNALKWSGKFTAEEVRNMTREQVRDNFKTLYMTGDADTAIRAEKKFRAEHSTADGAIAGLKKFGYDGLALTEKDGVHTLTYTAKNGDVKTIEGNDAIVDWAAQQVNYLAYKHGEMALLAADQAYKVSKAIMFISRKSMDEVIRQLHETGASRAFTHLGNSVELVDTMQQAMALQQLSEHNDYRNTPAGYFMAQQSRLMMDSIIEEGGVDAEAMTQFKKFMGGISLEAEAVDGVDVKPFFSAEEMRNGGKIIDGARMWEKDGVRLFKMDNGTWRARAEDDTLQTFTRSFATEAEATEYVNVLAAKRAKAEGRFKMMKQQAEQIYDNLFGNKSGEARSMLVLKSPFENEEVRDRLLNDFMSKGFSRKRALKELTYINGFAMSDGTFIVFTDNAGSLTQLAATIRHEGFHAGIKNIYKLSTPEERYKFAERAARIVGKDGGIALRDGLGEEITLEEFNSLDEKTQETVLEETLAYLCEVLESKPGASAKITDAVSELFGSAFNWGGLSSRQKAREARMIICEAFARAHDPQKAAILRSFGYDKRTARRSSGIKETKKDTGRKVLTFEQRIAGLLPATALTTEVEDFVAKEVNAQAAIAEGGEALKEQTAKNMRDTAKEKASKENAEKRKPELEAAWKKTVNGMTARVEQEKAYREKRQEEMERVAEETAAAWEEHLNDTTESKRAQEDAMWEAHEVAENQPTEDIDTVEDDALMYDAANVKQSTKRSPNARTPKKRFKSKHGARNARDNEQRNYELKTYEMIESEDVNISRAVIYRQLADAEEAIEALNEEIGGYVPRGKKAKRKERARLKKEQKRREAESREAEGNVLGNALMGEYAARAASEAAPSVSSAVLETPWKQEMLGKILARKQFLELCARTLEQMQQAHEIATSYDEKAEWDSKEKARAVQLIEKAKAEIGWKGQGLNPIAPDTVQKQTDKMHADYKDAKNKPAKITNAQWNANKQKGVKQTKAELAEEKAGASEFKSTVTLDEESLAEQRAKSGKFYEDTDFLSKLSPEDRAWWDELVEVNGWQDLTPSTILKHYGKEIVEAHEEAVQAWAAEQAAKAAEEAAKAKASNEKEASANVEQQLLPEGAVASVQELEDVASRAISKFQEELDDIFYDTSLAEEYSALEAGEKARENAWDTVGEVVEKTRNGVKAARAKYGEATRDKVSVYNDTKSTGKEKNKHRMRVTNAKKEYEKNVKQFRLALESAAKLGMPGAQEELQILRAQDKFQEELSKLRTWLNESIKEIDARKIKNFEDLGITKVLGRVTVESKTHFINRKIKEDGWSREKAEAYADSLYPFDTFQEPWINQIVYDNGGTTGHSPDTAATSLYREGLLPDEYVDDFWEAVSADVYALKEYKEHEKNAVISEFLEGVEHYKQEYQKALQEINADVKPAKELIEKSISAAEQFGADIGREIADATPTTAGPVEQIAEEKHSSFEEVVESAAETFVQDSDAGSATEETPNVDSAESFSEKAEEAKLDAVIEKMYQIAMKEDAFSEMQRAWDNTREDPERGLSKSYPGLSEKETFIILSVYSDAETSAGVKFGDIIGEDYVLDLLDKTADPTSACVDLQKMLSDWRENAAVFPAPPLMQSDKLIGVDAFSNETLDDHLERSLNGEQIEVEPIEAEKRERTDSEIFDDYMGALKTLQKDLEERFPAKDGDRALPKIDVSMAADEVVSALKAFYSTTAVNYQWIKNLGVRIGGLSSDETYELAVALLPAARAKTSLTHNAERQRVNVEAHRAATVNKYLNKIFGETAFPESNRETATFLKAIIEMNLARAHDKKKIKKGKDKGAETPVNNSFFNSDAVEAAEKFVAEIREDPTMSALWDSLEMTEEMVGKLDPAARSMYIDMKKTLDDGFVKNSRGDKVSPPKNVGPEIIRDAIAKFNILAHSDDKKYLLKEILSGLERAVKMASGREGGHSYERNLHAFNNNLRRTAPANEKFDEFAALWDAAFLDNAGLSIFSETAPEFAIGTLADVMKPSDNLSKRLARYRAMSDDELNKAFDEAEAVGDEDEKLALFEYQARRNGFLMEPLYHGTSNFGFKVFEPNADGTYKIFTAVKREDVSQSYTPFNSGVVRDLTENLPIGEKFKAAKRWASKTNPFLWVNDFEKVEMQKLAGEVATILLGSKKTAKTATLSEVARAFDEAVDVISGAVRTDGEAPESVDIFYDTRDAKTVRDLARKIVERDYVDAIDGAKMSKLLDGVLKSGSGIYHLLGAPGKVLEVDAKGSQWVTIDVSEYPELKTEENGGIISTDDAAMRAAELGYDSILIRNVLDGGPENEDGVQTPVDDLIFLKPGLLKLAALRTYDDNGKPIPLSERFNRSNPDIRYKIMADEGKPTNEGVDRAYRERISGRAAMLEAWGNKVYDKLINEQGALFRGFRKVVGDREVEDDLNVEVAAKNMHGKVRVKVDQIRDKYIKPLYDIIKENKLDVDRLNEYLYAKFAPERNAMIKARTAVVNPETGELETIVDDGSGMSDAKAKQLMHRFDLDPKRDAYNRAMHLVWQMNAASSKMMLDYGFVTQGQIDQWAKLSPHYVPLKDIETKKFTMRRAAGRKTEADNPLAASIHQANAIIRAGEASNVNKVVARFVEKYDPDGKVMGGKVLNYSGDRKGVFKSAPMFVPNNSEAERELRDLGVALVETDESRELGGKFVAVDNKVPIPNELRVRIMRSKSSAPNAATFWENGTRRFVVFDKHNQEAMKIADALNHAKLQRPDKDSAFAGLWDLSQRLVRFKADVSTTLNPRFILRNTWADFFNTSLILATEGKWKQLGGFAKHYLGAIKTVRALAKGKDISNTKLGKYYLEAREQGMLTGVYGEGTFKDAAHKLERDVKRLKGGNVRAAWEGFKEFMETVGSYPEQGARLAVYAAMRDNGMSPAKAAQYGREVTVDFNAKGQVTPWVNSLYMFSNAGAQGIYRAIQAVKTGAEARGGGAQGYVKALLPGVSAAMIMGFVSAMLMDMMGGDDEDEGIGSARDRLPKHVKDSALAVPLGDGKYLQLPTRGMWQPFTRLGGLIYDFGKGTASGSEVALGFTDAIRDSVDFIGGSAPTFAQWVMPTAIDPFIQVLEGKDWTGKDLYLQDFGQKQAQSHRGKSGTGNLYKMVAQGLNSITGGDKVQGGLIDVHPETLQLFSEFFLGSLMTMGDDAWQTVEALTGKEGDYDVKHTPFVGGVLREVGGIEQQYYGAYKEFNDISKTYDAYLKQAKDSHNIGERQALKHEADKMLKQHPWLRSAKGLRKMAKSIQDLNSKIQNASSKEQRDALKKALKDKERYFVKTVSKR